MTTPDRFLTGGNPPNTPHNGQSATGPRVTWQLCASRLIADIQVRFAFDQRRTLLHRWSLWLLGKKQTYLEDIE